MLTVTFRTDSRNRLSAFFADGHAEFSDHGSDVVCAGVSAILQAAVLGLTEHAHLALAATMASGQLAVEIPPEARNREDVCAIVDTARLSIEQIARQYPDHVRVTRSTTRKDQA